MDIRRIKIERHPKLKLGKNPDKEYFEKRKQKVQTPIVTAKNSEEMLEPYEWETLMYGSRGRGSNSFPLFAYTSKKYQKLTKGMICSYPRKGNPWDNACIESYHAIIKREWLNRFKIMNYDQAYKLVFEYLEGFYNIVRIHSHCNYLSPNSYEINQRISEN